MKTATVTTAATKTIAPAVTASKRGRPEVYTAPRLAKIVDMVKKGRTVKAAMASLNSKNKLTFTYVPLLVAAKRHGISFRELTNAAKKLVKK